MKSVSVSLMSLYEKFNGVLNSGIIEKTIDGETEYFDLFVNNQLVCMDGEACKVIEVNDDNIVLVNDYGEQNYPFTLTIDEMKVGVYHENLC